MTPEATEFQQAQAERDVRRLTYERWFPRATWTTREGRLRIEDAALDAFMREAIVTKDEHDDEHPLKPLPLDELPYIRIWFRILLRERLAIDPKSRQTLMTWATLSFVTWRLMRFPHQKWAWVAQKKEDGLEHIEDRLKSTIWQNLPGWLTGMYTMASIKGTFHLTHFCGQVWNSALIAYPKGANQLRGKTHTGIVIDEAAHVHDLQPAWKGFAPTTQSRKGKAGQIILVSSAERGSYFQRLAGAPLQEAVMVARGLKQVA